MPCICYEISREINLITFLSPVKSAKFFNLIDGILLFCMLITTCSYSHGTGTIWLDDLQCTTSDLMLSTCSHNGFGNENCGHSEDVAVSCSAIGILYKICASIVQRA
jgi:hypothetical protein